MRIQDKTNEKKPRADRERTSRGMHGVLTSLECYLIALLFHLDIFPRECSKDFRLYP